MAVEDKLSKSSENKLFSRKEVEQRKNSKETWIIIHNNVYDVTEFLNEVNNISPHSNYFIYSYPNLN